MSLRRLVLVAVLAAPLLVGGACRATAELKRIERLAPDDPPVRARAAVAAVAARPTHDATRREAESALRSLILWAARPVERDATWGSLTDRLADLDAALAIVDRAAKQGLASDRETLASAREACVTALVAANLVDATAAVAEGSYAVAVVRLEQSEALQAGHLETVAALAAARRAWAALDLTEGRPRDAAERLARGSDRPVAGGDEDRSRAAELFASLGTSALARGGCRAASRDLQRAADLGRDVAADLEAAQTCARTAVSVLVEVHRTTPLPVLEARILERLAELGSPHLEVVAADAPGPARLVPAGPEGPPRADGPYEVQLAVGLPAFRTQPPRSTSRTITQRALGRCVDPYGTPWPSRCEVDLRITYEEVRERVDGEVGAVLRVVGTQPAPQDLARFPLRVTGQEVAAWRGDVLSVASAGPYDSWTSMQWQPRTTAATRAREPRADARERLVDQLSVDLADRVAREIIAAIDGERAVPDALVP